MAGAAERRAAAHLLTGALLAAGPAGQRRSPGSTYAFTGEGIGKALETGMHAAEALLQRARSGRRGRARRLRGAAQPPARASPHERANWVNRHPWLADLVLWRGTRSERVRRRMSGVLDESSNPASCSPPRASTASSPNSARHVPTARPERQHAHRRGVQLHRPSTRAEEHKDGFGIAFFEGAARAWSSSTRRARAIRRWPRWCGATRSRAATSSRTSARPRRAASRWRTHPFQRELWGAPGCSRTTAT